MGINITLKKPLALILCVLMLVNVMPVFASVSVIGVELDKTNLSLNVGETETIIASVNPTEAQNKAVTWKSSNESVVTVDNNGVITGVNVGTAVITITTDDGNFTADCSVTVTKSIMAVTGISLDKNNTIINVGRTEDLVATVTPDNATNQKIIWSSNNEEIAIVDETGRVTGINEGKTTITVTTDEGEYSAYCTVEVTAELPEKDLLSLEKNNEFLPKLSKEKNNRFIIKYKDSKKKQGNQALTETLQDKLKNIKKHHNFDIITTTTETSAEDIFSELKQKKSENDIEYIQPDYKINLSSNDTYFNMQWGLYNQETVAGSVYNTTTGTVYNADIRIDANIIPAWEFSQGNGITVAVIDTGIDITHEDLINNIWHNTGEIPDNGIDDDQNGYIDDFSGWNFVDENNIVHNSETTNDEIHGTSIAGVIAAEKDNNIGIAGVAPTAKILPIKAFQNGYAFTSDLIQAIDYAEGMGIKIVNCSWESNETNQALMETMEEKNMLFICAAGNGNQDIDQEQVFPASFALQNIIVVSSLNKEGHLSSFSNYGLNTVDVAAPGEEIISTVPGDEYITCSGTSLAAAFISGEAALILSNNPQYSLIALKEQIISSSEHYSTLLDKVIDGNKLNAENALTNIYPDANEIINIPAEVQEPFPVESVSLNRTSTIIGLGTTITLVATVLPENATNKEITWNSSDGTVATVNENGTVTGISAGFATITVTTNDGGFTADCTVEVRELFIPVTGVSLNKTNSTITINGIETLIATIANADATNQDVTWSSSDETIATVDQDGIVNGLSTGTATITVTTDDGGYTANCTIEVTAGSIPTEGITLNKKRTYLTVGSAEILEVSVLPEYVGQNLIWSSSNEDVATVDQEGNITAIGEGFAVIVVKTEDGNNQANCVVRVVEYMINAQCVNLTTTNAGIAIGQDLQLFATVLPEYATNTYVTWTSSNESIAKVGWDGIVTGIAEGTATITAHTLDGGYTADCQINVSSFIVTDDLFTSSSTESNVLDDYERYFGFPYSITTNNSESVNQRTSNLAFEKALISLPGRNGLDLEIGVRFDSLKANFGDPRSRLKSGKYQNYIKADTYLEKRFNLGAGWSFNFPSIEILSDTSDVNDDIHFVNSDGDKVYTVARYLHLPTGEILRIGTLGGFFWSYQLKDKVVDVNINEFSNGSVTSNFRLTYKNGLKYYFDNDGKLIGIVDRYGNTIKYVYSTNLITITDTLGRVTKIKYNGLTGSDRKVYIIAPGDSESNPTYEISFMSINMGFQNYYNQQFISMEYKLREIKNLKNTEDTTNFEYTYMPVEYSWDYFNHYGMGRNYYASLSKITYPTGASTQYSFNTEERRWNSSYGGSLFQYPEINTRSDVENSNVANKLTYDFNGLKEVISGVINEDKVKTSYEFNKDKGYLTKETTKLVDGTTNMVLREDTYTYKYDCLINKQTTVVHGYEGDNINTVTSKTLVKTWDYNIYGDLLQEVNELGYQTNYTYETNFHRPTLMERQINDTLIKKTIYTINPSNGNITQMKQHHFEGTTDKTIVTNYPSYDSYGNLLTKEVIMEDGSIVRENYQYSSTYNNGYLTKKTINAHDYQGTVETIEGSYTYYMNTGLVASYTDGNNHTTSYEYDSVGRKIKETNSDNSFKTINYDDINNITTLTLENGHKIRNDYDGLGRLVKREELQEGTSNTWITLQTNKYNYLSELEWSQDTDSHRTSYEYDLFGRVKKIINPDSTYRLTKYYDVTNKKEEINEEGAEHTYYFDDLGQLIREQFKPDQGGSTVYTTYYQYDKLGNLTYIKDPKNYETNYQYDDLGRLVKVLNAKGEATFYQYSNLGNLIKTTIQEYDAQGGLTKQLVTEKKYDELGRLIKNYETYDQASGPNNKVEYFSYDKAGNLKKKIDMKGNTINYTYDVRNRVLTVVSRNPQGIIDKQYTYNYNNLYSNNYMTITDERGVTTYTYYANGKIKSHSLPNTTTQKTSYEYYNDRNLKKITDPFGLAVSYQYDTNNRMDTVTVDGKVFNYDYYADGMIKSLQYPIQSKVVKTEYTYFDTNLLKTLKNTIGTGVDLYSYSYDGNGNVISIMENSNNSSYGYDELNRLLTATKPSNNITFQYDARGNRTQMNGGSGNFSLPPCDLSYDSFDQLSQFIEDGTQYQYNYDHNGLRVKKTTPTEITQYYYGLNDKTIAETNGTGEVTAQNIWGHKPLARKVNGQYYYYLYNGHGDVVKVLDNNGNIVNNYQYDEWGNIISKTEGISNPIRYSGEYYDEESGLYYLRARYYDPSTGRFISRDTYEGDIANPLSINQYSYCYNNPLIYCDPSGHYTDYSQIDYAKEAARMNISQTGAWRDEVDQRLADIGSKYMGGSTDLHIVAAILQTVNTTTSSSAAGGSPSKNGNVKPSSTKTLSVSTNTTYESKLFPPNLVNEMNNLMTVPQAISKTARDTFMEKSVQNSSMELITFTGSVVLVNSIDPDFTKLVNNNTFTRIYTGVGLMSILAARPIIDANIRNIMKTFRSNLDKNLGKTGISIPDTAFCLA